MKLQSKLTVAEIGRLNESIESDEDFILENAIKLNYCTNTCKKMIYSHIFRSQSLITLLGCIRSYRLPFFRHQSHTKFYIMSTPVT